MEGYRFGKYTPPKSSKNNGFENLLDMFLQLLSMAGGDVGKAMAWLTDLDRQHNLIEEGYGIGDFFEGLKEKGYQQDINLYLFTYYN